MAGNSIRTPVQHTTGDTGPGQQCRKTVTPVISSVGTAAILELRRPPHLSHTDHQSFIEHAAIVHVFEQSRNRLIQPRQEMIPQAGRHPFMGVPSGGRAVGHVPDDGHETGSRFDHTAADHQRLPKQMTSIPIAECNRLASDIQCCAKPLRTDHSQCRASVPPVTGRPGGSVEALLLNLELFQQAAPPVETVQGHPVTQRQTTELKLQFLFGAIAKVRVVQMRPLADACRQGVIFGTQPSRVLTQAVVPPTQLDLSVAIGKVDITGNRRATGLATVEVGHHRPHRGPVVGCRVDIGRPAFSRRHRPTGLDDMSRVVIVLRVIECPNDCVPIRTRRQPRKVLADPHSRRPRRDRRKRPVHRTRCLGLHVECLELAGSAEQIQEHHGLGPRSRPHGPGNLGRSDRRRPHAQQPRPPHLQHLPTADAVTEALRSSQDLEHGQLSGRGSKHGIGKPA